MVLSWYEFQYHSNFLIQIVTFTSGIDFRFGQSVENWKTLHLGESQTKKLNSYQLVIRCFLEILKMNNVKFVQSYTSSESSPSRHQVSPDVPRLVPPPLALPPSISTSSTNLDQKPNDFEVIKLENQVIHSIKNFDSLKIPRIHVSLYLGMDLENGSPWNEAKLWGSSNKSLSIPILSTRLLFLFMRDSLRLYFAEWKFTLGWIRGWRGDYLKPRRFNAHHKWFNSIPDSSNC